MKTAKQVIADLGGELLEGSGFEAEEETTELSPVELNAGDGQHESVAPHRKFE